MRRCLFATAVIVGLTLASVSTAGAAGLYAPEYGSGPPEAIAGYSRAADGSLSPLPGSPFGVGPMTVSPGGMIALAFTPDGGRAVASFLFKGGLLGLTANPTGSVAAAGSPILTPSVTGLAVSPDGRFAYAPTREFNAVPAAGILGYSIGADGSLTELSQAPFGTGAYGDVAITPDAHFLYATTGTQVVRFAIGADGNLTEAGMSAISANTLEVSPDGRFLFAGSATGVTSYSIAADGSLSQNGSEAAGNTELSYFAVAPDGGHIYMADYNAKAIVTAAVGADGALSVAGSTPVEEAKSVAVSPDGRFLYYARPDLEDIGVASISADGLPTLLPSSSPWHSGESERLVFQPGPAPTASFASKLAAAGAPSSFNATGSTSAAHYRWDFGDGTTLADAGPTPTHTYAKPGAYMVTLTVSDAQGCSTQLIYTGQSTVCPGGASARTTARLDVPAVPPAITALSVTNRRFAVPPTRAKHVKRGTAFRYSLSEPASVALTIELEKSGRRVGKRCEAATRQNRGHKSCPLFKSVGTITAAGNAGANQTKFSGRLHDHKLKPGPYRATALATDSSGGKSAPRSVSFVIVQARSTHS